MKRTPWENACRWPSNCGVHTFTLDHRAASLECYVVLLSLIVAPLPSPSHPLLSTSNSRYASLLSSLLRFPSLLRSPPPLRDASYRLEDEFTLDVVFLLLIASIDTRDLRGRRRRGRWNTLVNHIAHPRRYSLLTTYFA